MEALATQGDVQKLRRSYILHFAHTFQGEAQYLTGEFAAAERSEARAVELGRELNADAIVDRRRLSEVVIWLALAQARQGHTDQAARTIAPVVKFSIVPSANDTANRFP